MHPDPKQVLTELSVLSAQNGSETAFRDLHDLWDADLRRLALVRVESSAAADEVVTDVWLAIVRGLARLDDPACFPRWAFRILDRRCTDWIRRRMTARRQAATLEAEAANFAPADAPGVRAGEPTDDVMALRTAVARLPVGARELLHLYYELGRSMAEIAEILDVPAGTVKSRLFTVRETLKLQLENKSQ